MKNEFKEIEVVSSLDGSCEKNLFFYPSNIGEQQNVPQRVIGQSIVP